MTFEEHIRSEHNMWHYLYFIVLIKVKDPTEFTGPESYVHQMVKVSDCEGCQPVSLCPDLRCHIVVKNPICGHPLSLS